MDINTKHEAIKTRFNLISPHLSEQARRLFVAAEAKAFGRGGISIVAKLTGVSRAVIAAGIKELEGPSTTKNAKKGRGP